MGYRGDTYPDELPARQAHWLLSKKGGDWTWTSLQLNDDGSPVDHPGLVKTLRREKRRRYVWGNRDGNRTKFWVTQDHAFVYECEPYSRDAHLAYARELSWLIDNNTYYIYLDGVRYRLPGAGWHRFHRLETLVHESIASHPEIKDDNEWEAPPIVDHGHWEYLLDHSSSFSDVTHFSDLFNPSTWAVHVPEGSDNRSVCSESDARQDRKTRRIGTAASTQTLC